MQQNLKGVRVGYAVCGSFCTFEQTFLAAMELVALGCDLTPIMSFHAAGISTRFGMAQDNKARLEGICDKPVICTIEGAEPIGPKKALDIIVVAPCTGNTLAKLALGITDTPVTMAVKAHIRNMRPALLAVATNDALAGSSKNIGALQNFKNYYFVPMRQDDVYNKPNSLVANLSMLPDAIEQALLGKQLQPLFCQE